MLSLSFSKARLLFISLLIFAVDSQEQECLASATDCLLADANDSHEDCAAWAARGDCEREPSRLHRICQKICSDQICVNLAKDSDCETWANMGECTKNPGYMLEQCSKSCRVCQERTFSIDQYDVGADLGEPQSIDNRPSDIAPNMDKVPMANITHVLNEARKYMLDEAPKKFDPPILKECRNEFELCAKLAATGHCESTADLMKKHCAPVCKSCEYKTIQGRCPIDPTAPKAWASGDLNAMFTRLTKEPYKSRFDVQVLSSPTTTDGPWVITMENVLTESEAQRLVELGSTRGFERSVNVGKKKSDGSREKATNDKRTSTNAWCDARCYQDDEVKNLVGRLENITGIPDTNSENFQILKYEPGQFYKSHHDYIPYFLERQCGPRIMTMYLYLNDVEEGGGTNFDQLNLTVMPKRGRALLWPSVKDEDPLEKDPSTTHQALPVIKGIKYGANAWVHQGDFKTTNAQGCT